MQQLDFILWMCLFPVCTALNGYISTKENKLKGKKYSDGTEAASSLVVLVAYIWIAVLLYQN